MTEGPLHQEAPRDQASLLLLVADGADRTQFNPPAAIAPPTCTLIEATALAQALDLWFTGRADWAVLDLAWAEGSGLAFLSTLGECQQRPLPVIVLVGPGQEHAALEAMKLGAADYLLAADLTPEALWARLGKVGPGAQRSIADSPDKALQHYQNLVENSPDIIERFDRHLRHLYVSPALTRTLGIDASVCLGKTCRELGLDEAMVNDWETAAAVVLATGEKQAIEFTTPTLVGQRHFEMAIAPEWSEQGQIESLLCISRDISDRVVAQQTQQRLLTAAQAAQRDATAARDGLARVFDRINDGIIAFDRDSRCVYLNPSGEQILRRSALQILGNHVWDEFPEAVETPIYAVYHRAIEQQQPEFLEYYFPPLDTWFEMRLYPDSNGTTVYFTDINDRKAAAASRQKTEQLRHELALLERILESILAGYWDIDFVANTGYMSPSLKLMLGYADHELSNTIDTWQTLMVPEDLPSTLDNFNQHVQSHGEVPYYNEVRYRHKDGSVVWMICAGQVVAWDDAGHPLQMVGCHVDITQLKQTEAQLRKNRVHLQEAQRIGNLGSWEFEVATDRIVWSEQVYRIFGLEVGASPPSFEALQSYFHPDDQTRHRQTVEATLTTHQPYDEEFCIVRADGSQGYIHAKGEALVDSAGQLTHLTGTVQDISDRKHSEAERQRAETQLQDLSLRLSLALESGRIGTWDWDLRQAVHWDQRMYEIWGFEDLGRAAVFDDWAVRVHCDDWPTVEAAIHRALEDGLPYDIEFRFYRPDGELRWIRAAAMVQRSPAGAALAMVGINYDITEQKRAEAELLRTTAQLRASNHELEAFAYSVSHDLRAPLRAIDGFSRALVEDYGEQVGEEGHDYFSRIRHNVGRMGQLIDDLLRLSRVSRQAVTYVPVDLSALVQEQFDELQRVDGDRTVTVTIAPRLTVTADPTLMRVAIANLVQNAWKFTAHQPGARIEFGLERQRGEPVYYLRDNGAGFDMAYADKLFGVFQRLHNTDEFPGTGIGLATVQRAIHRQGGRVWAEAAIEQGATFYFTLPQAVLGAEVQP